MQHAIDTQTHATGIAPRLDMNIAGTLLEGVLEQPVDDVDHMGIVGVRLLTHAAQVKQLLEVADTAGLLIGRIGAGHGASESIELHRIALQVFRIGNDPADIALEHMPQVVFPALDKGLGTGNGDLPIIHFHRQNPVTLGERKGHQRCHRRHVDLQRINAIPGLVALAGQPAAEAVQIQCFARSPQVIDILTGDKLQRVQLGGIADS